MEKPKHPGGRPPGSPNKTTIQARESIAMFVDGNVERLTGWLDQIAEENPKAAFDSFMSVVEYHIPKLARSETKLEGKIEIDAVGELAEKLSSNVRKELISTLSVDKK